MHVHMHTHKHMHACAYTYTHKHVHMHTRTLTCMHSYACAHTLQTPTLLVACPHQVIVLLQYTYEMPNVAYDRFTGS